MPNNNQFDWRGLLKEVIFREPLIAERNLARLSEGLTSAGYQRVHQLLPDVPDPDSVLTYLNRLLENSAEESHSQLLADSELLHYACLIFGQSRWLSEALIRNPSLLRRVRKQDLGRARSREEFREEFARTRTRSADADLSLLLAKFRKTAYVRILLRDILGIAKLAEITEEISALSDVLIEEALNVAKAELIRRHGIPRSVDSADRQYPLRSAVISLGKLGGSELNYSSDVDLMFLYEGGPETGNSTLTNREFFLRLAERTTGVLSLPTAEGQVFRIDLRLRPEGRGGDVAVSLPRAIQYYSEIAEDWELQAMIKARHTAGDASLTREFLRAIEPAVYKPDVNFAAVKTALKSRERMDQRNRTVALRDRSIRRIDVKLDRGGIRDIEFLVQCLQRVYGGEESWLRSRGTLFALQNLHDKEHISGKDFHMLTKAYEFLRSVEHRLQLRNGQQVHQLPADEAELEVVAKSIAGKHSSRPSSEEFISEVKMQMSAVSDIYHRVIYVSQSREGVEQNVQSQLTLERPVSAEESYSQVMHRLASDAPQLVSTLKIARLSQHARRNLTRFLNSAATSQERFAAALAEPEAMQKAIRVFENNQFLADLLVRYPADVGALQVPRSNDLFQANSADFAQAQKNLRQQYRRAVLSANSGDFSDSSEIWALLSENTEIAERALRFASTVSGAPPGFAVMALGRLGSREFDVMSDADLLFVADESADAELCRLAAERMVELLSAYTFDGAVFSIDTRLRPRGADGELVTSRKHLEQYFHEEAEAWEALTYLRLRYVAGSREVAEQAIQSVREGTVRLSREASFARELVKMRQRLEESDLENNLKTGRGGAYDIDFLVGGIQARHAIWEDGNLADRVGAVAAAGLLTSSEARLLAHNAEFLRKFEHVVRLVTGRTAKWMPKAEHARAMTAKLLGLTDPEGRLRDALDSTRVVYRKYLFH